MTTAPAPVWPSAAAPRRGGGAVRMAWMLARPGAQSAATIVLPAVAFAVTTALLLTVLAGVLMFWGGDGGASGPFYGVLSLIALSLLFIPLVALGGAAARLSARRRDDRLATLRLLGATTGLVARITVLESAAVAAMGAVAGVALYVAALPAVGAIRFFGEPIGVVRLWLGAPLILAVVAGVIAIAAVSAAVGLRAVTISPLGVRTKAKAPTMHWLRAVIAVVAVAGAYALLSGLSAVGGAAGAAAMIAVLVVAFAIGVGILNLVGPWVIAVVAKAQLRRAKTAQQLIAARAILESPKALWRQVGGLAMTSFVAVVAGSGMSLISAASGGASDASELVLIEDIRTGILITLVMSFVMVACSVGVNQAAQVLDRRDLYVSLDRVGMPRSIIEASRVRTVAVPVVTVVLGSAVVGGVLVFPLLGLSMIIAPLSLAVIAGSFVLGLAIVWLGLLASRPVLTAVLARPEAA